MQVQLGTASPSTGTAAPPRGGGRISDTSFTLGTNAALAAISFIAGPLLARLLGVVGRGEIAAIQMIAMPLSTIAMLGQMEATVYFSVRDSERASRYISTASVIAFCASIPLCLAAYFVVPGALRHQPAYVVSIARWYLLLVPLYALIYVPLQGLRPLYMRLWNVCRTLPNVAWLAAVLAAAAFGLHTSKAIVVGHLVGLAVVLPIILCAVLWHVHGRFLPAGKYVGRMLRFGVPSSAGTLSQWLNFRVDQLLMVVFLPTAGIGLYSVASGWASALLPAFTALGFVALPAVAGSKNQDEREQRFGNSVRRAMLAGLLIVAIGIPTAPLAVRLLFGQAFVPAVAPAIVLIVGTSLAGVNLVVEDCLRGVGSPRAVMLAETAGWCTTAICVYPAVVRYGYGVMGLAFSSLAGYVLTFVLLASFTCKRMRLPFFALFIPTGVELRALGEVLPRFRKASTASAISVLEASDPEDRVRIRPERNDSIPIDLLFIAPLPPPYAGPETATESLLSSTFRNRFRIHMVPARLSASNETKGEVTLGRVVRLGAIALRITYLRIRHRCSLAYLYISQNRPGILRDSVLFISLKLLGCRVVWHFRGGNLDVFYRKAPRALQWWIKWMLNHSDGLILLGPSIANRMQAIGLKVPMHVVPNWAPVPDPMRNRFQAPALNRESDRMNVLVIGSVSVAKGTAVLLRAAEQVLRIDRNVRFIIAGECIEKENNILNDENGRPLQFESIRELLTDMTGRYPENIIYAGVAAPDRKWELLSEADLLVLPSYSEGFPITILEAMFAGLPIVTTPVGAIPDFLRADENACFVRPGDVEGLAEILLSLARRPEERVRMAANNYRYVRSQLSLENSAELISDVLERVYA